MTRGALRSTVAKRRRRRVWYGCERFRKNYVSADVEGKKAWHVDIFPVLAPAVYSVSLPRVCVQRPVYQVAHSGVSIEARSTAYLGNISSGIANLNMNRIRKSVPWYKNQQNINPSIIACL